MKAYLVLVCSFFVFYVEAASYTEEDVQKLIAELPLKRETVQSVARIIETAKKIRDEESREQLYFELCRAFSYIRDIPFFSEGTFLEQQLRLLCLAAKVLKQSEKLSLADYPTDGSRSYIRFIFDVERAAFPFSFGKHKPFAVFKAQSDRINEILTWELGCLFGIEEAFTPAITLHLEGNRGELQIFQSNDVTLQQSYNENLYACVTEESYLKCALGILLFALEDIHNENCYFQFRKEGYLQMGMFDTTAAFYRTIFTPHTKEPGYPALLTPYNWIGWDFPQLDRKISKKLKHWLVLLIQSWPERIKAFQKYRNHPMTLYALSKKKTDGIVKRSQQLHNLIRQNPQQPVRAWHEALVPNFPIIEKKLKEFIPKKKTTWVLFRLHWSPQFIYQQVPQRRREEFKRWLEHFLTNPSQLQKKK